MKFYISVVETHSTLVEVEAENSEEAINKTIDACNEGIICLDDEGYTDDLDFIDETDKWKDSLAQFQVIN